MNLSNEILTLAAIGVAVVGLQWRMNAALKADLNGRMDRIEGRIDGMQTNLNGRIDTMNAALNGRMDSLNSRMDTLKGVTA